MATRPPAAAPAMTGRGTPSFLGLLSIPLLCCCPEPTPNGPGPPARGAGAGANVPGCGASIDKLGVGMDGLGANLEVAGARGAGMGTTAGA